MTSLEKVTNKVIMEYIKSQDIELRSMISSRLVPDVGNLKSASNWFMTYRP